MAMTFDDYIKKIEEDLRRGNATELTYRSSMENLIESYGKGIDASSDPKHIACGAPDFIVEKGKVPLGYVETKDIGTDLDKEEKKDQMKRYLKALHNLILTDYLEFRWYVNGERKLKLKIADIGKNNRLIVNPKGAEICEQLFHDFFATETPTVGTPKELAIRLAGVTHFIRDQIANALESGDAEVKKALEQQYKTFVDLLLPALTPREFADLYAQAITYGLFAAKLSAPEGAPFSFEDAYKYLRVNPFLRRLFMDVNEQLDEIDIIHPYLKDLVSLLNRADFGSILADFGRRTRTEDPVVHFYETFLATYDPKLRESRGVYYTPEPVVQFIVRAVDDLLKTRFGKSWGLADESVKVLDPATGTGTFLYYVIQQIHDEIVNERKQAGQWQEKSKAMLKRLFGFELLIAPYVVSHLKLGLLLQQLGVPLEGKDERLHVYLTNTLEEGVERAEILAGLGSNIADESNEAAKVKKMQDIMVVLGNPPYSNFGMMNKGKWILGLLEDYKKGLNEKKINLDDDFIKFIKYAQWRINKTGQGVLGFITNNTYIDGITHRRMRESLLETFDEICILDLHGSTRKKETTPIGRKDENVFDIRQGVAILLAIKTSNELAKKNSFTKVHHFSLWGLRKEKYTFLQNTDLEKIDWSELKPNAPNYFLTIKDFSVGNEYKKYCPIPSIFLKFGNGIGTDRDSLFYDDDPNELKIRMETFFSEQGLLDPFRSKYRIFNSSGYPLLDRRKKSNFSQILIRKCLYRPFDKRWLYYDPKLTSRPAYDVMRQLDNEMNLSLLLTRQISTNEFKHVFISSEIIDRDPLSLATKERTQVFPLYIYTTPEETENTLFSQSHTTHRPNLSTVFIKEFSARLGLQFIEDGEGDKKTTFGPEDAFYYMYAMFHSPTYRTRYAEFLKIDFPRLPLTSNKKLFAALVAKGRELVELHLLKSKKVEEFITTFPVAGENKVEKVRYETSPRPSPKMGGSGGKVWINPKQYFGGVPEEVWNFKIGGYQVCEKWLKDRKGRVLSGEDISRYQRVVVALKETIRLMKEIDKAIPGWPVE
jgi:hypothetical protein